MLKCSGPRCVVSKVLALIRVIAISIATECHFPCSVIDHLMSRILVQVPLRYNEHIEHVERSHKHKLEKTEAHFDTIKFECKETSLYSFQLIRITLSFSTRTITYRPTIWSRVSL